MFSNLRFLLFLILLSSCNNEKKASGIANAPAAAAIKSDNDLNIEMVFVEGGSFTMGCTEVQGGDCIDDEKPAHTVTLSDFYIAKYELTQAQWKELMGINPASFKSCPECPLEYASWDEIQKFIRNLNLRTGKNYRLPTEAEWEYAAGGGKLSKGYKYAGSNSIEEVAWYRGNSNRETHPVGGKRANELGIYDMSGNIGEWCSDWYAENYYANSAASNPSGASSGSERVLRGGCRTDREEGCRISRRYKESPMKHLNGGIRLVLVP